MNHWTLLVLFTFGLGIYELTGKISWNMYQNRRIGAIYNIVVAISANGLALSVISLIKLYHQVAGTKPFLLKTIKRNLIALKTIFQEAIGNVKMKLYTFTKKNTSKD